MGWRGSIFVALSLLLTLIAFSTADGSDFNPYDVLQVGRRSTTDQIRTTYKKLAREWHPDKNKDPNAGHKFMEINRAYEILGDEKKREQYDRFGKVDDNQQVGNGGQHGGQFFRTPFGNFQFFGGAGRETNANSITERFLQNHILPESYEKPYFFFATTDFCFNCMRVQPVWEQFTNDLQTLDLGFGEVDVDYEHKVVSRLRVPRIPCIGAIINGRSIIFDSGQYSVKVLRQFLRKLMPDDLINVVDENTVDSFLGGWKDNRVQLMFFGTQGLPSMRMIIPIYQVRQRVSAVYIDTNSEKNLKLLDRFDVEPNTETLLIFKEDEENPVYPESSREFNAGSLLDTLKANKYLRLPRLSSPTVYDDLCPGSDHPANSRYCVILTFDSTLFEHEDVRRFRETVFSGRAIHNINFLYAFTNIQRSVCETWKRPDGDFKVAILARHSAYDVDISWLDWCSGRCETELNAVINRLTTHEHRFNSHSVKRYDIRDEQAGGLMSRIVKRLKDWWDHFTYTYFDGDHTLTVISILSTLVCVIIVSFLLNFMTNSPTQANDAANNPRSAAARSQQQSRYAKEPGKFTVYDLRHHNYNKLIREALPGYRFILLFVDEGNKQQYIRRFADLMMPFNRTPYFLFGFVYIDKYIAWYQRLLSQTIGFREELRDVRPDQCVGTVLAINGAKKYYNIYHPKTLNIRDRQQQGDGAFVGLDDSSDSEHEGMNGSSLNGNARPVDGNALLHQGRPLDGLGHWVDRLFDGSLPKCKIDFWPVFPSDVPANQPQLEEEKKEQ